MKFVFALIVAGIVGATAAWYAVDQQYGHRDAYLGPMDLAGTVTSENVVAHIESKLPDSAARVATPGGTEHDFGVMSPGEKGQHVFTIKNIGREDLSLKVGASTCKCTVGSLKRNVLAPGEETDIKLEWTVKSAASSFQQSAEVRTNDPNNVAVSFRIRGKVVRTMDFAPDTIAFGDVAAGESIDLETKLYSYLDSEIEPIEVQFSSESMNELANFDVTEFSPTQQDDGIYSSAHQAFRIRATVEPGLPQGPIQETLTVHYRRIGDGETAAAAENENGDEIDIATTAVSGRVVGALSMILSSRLSGGEDSPYVYDFGRLSKDDPKVAKTLVALKGPQREDTTLRVGDVSPKGFVQATLQEPMTRGEMSLYRLNITLVPGEEPIERMGKTGEDFGWVMIESDNAKVPPMKLRLKFGLEAE